MKFYRCGLFAGMIVIGSSFIVNGAILDELLGVFITAIGGMALVVAAILLWDHIGDRK